MASRSSWKKIHTAGTAERGGTRVVLRRYGLPDDSQRAHHRKGWLLYLDRLGLRARGGDPGPDPDS